MYNNFIVEGIHYFMKNGIVKKKNIGEQDRKGKRISLEQYDEAWNKYRDLMGY